MDKFDMLLELQRNYETIKESSKELKDGSFIYLLKKVKDDFETTKNKFKEKENEIKLLRQKYKEINEKVNASKKEIEKNEYQLYNTAGSNIKLIEGLQKKVSDVKQVISELDSQSLELLEMEDKLTFERDKLKMKLSELKEEFNSVKDAGSKKINHAKEEMAKAQDKIAELEKSIPESLLKKFNSLREIKGTAVAKYDHDVCQGCKMKISAITIDKIKKGYNIVYCDNCGRILYYNDKDSSLK
ncbi:MAG: zinc ribbon domain-containing protein [Clostridiaceae bacterium]